MEYPSVLLMDDMKGQMMVMTTDKQLECQ
jgi:hypothetical protein